jgi:hypothetical protein
MSYDNIPDSNDRLLLRSTTITPMSYDNIPESNDRLLLRSTTNTQIHMTIIMSLMTDFY